MKSLKKYHDYTKMQVTNIKMGQLYLSTSHLLVLKFEKYQNWGLLSHSFLVWTTICQLTKFKHSKISKVKFVFNILLQDFSHYSKGNVES